MNDQPNAGATSETAQTWKTIYTKHTLSHPNRANMDWWLRWPNDTWGPLGPNVSWHLSYRWGKSPKKPHPGNLSRPGMEPGSSFSPYISSPLVPIFSKIYPISRITTHLPQIHFNSILLSTSRPPFPSGFPSKTLYAFLDSSIRATCPAHLSRLDMIPNYVRRRIQCM